MDTVRAVGTQPKTERRRMRPDLVVVGICMAAIIFDGYDLMVFGTVVPSLLQYDAWNLTPPMIGALGAYGVIGMVVGALVAGAITDRVGRKRVIIVGIIWISLGSALMALSPSVQLFGFFRFVNGIGLGGILPSAIALTAEFSTPGRRNRNNAIMFSGIAIGASLAALVAIPLIPAFGFRIMFWLGVFPLVLLPIIIRYLPESVAFLLARGRTDAATHVAAGLGRELDDFQRPEPTVAPAEAGKAGGNRGPIRLLFSSAHGLAACLLALASFMGLLLTHGLTTWLPGIMHSAGYELTSSLVFLLALNAGAIVGAISISPLADRYGPKPITIVAFSAAAISITLLSNPYPLPALYGLVVVAGFGSIGTQILLNGYVATYFPATIRATALGWTLGVGRLGAVAGPIIGGLVLGASVDHSWNFYAYAIPAVLGALVVVAVPRSRAARTPERV